MTEPTIPNAIIGRCPNCRHVWIVARLPMEITKAARAMKRATCPSCGGTKKIALAEAEDIRRAGLATERAGA